MEVWTKVLGKRQLNKLSIDQKNLLTRVTVGYILRIYSFRDVLFLGRKLNISIERWRELRHMLLSDFRTVLGIKMLLMRCQTKRLLDRSLEMRSELKMAKLRRNDRAIFYHLADMKLDKLLNVQLENLPGETIPTTDQIVAECGVLLSDKSISDWIGKFVYRKMRFMFTSQNLEARDFIAELNAKATATFFFVTPFQTDLHRRNTTKRATHNHGILMMNDYNKNNPRLFFDGQKWINLVQMNTAHTANESGDASDSAHTSLASVNMGLPSFTRIENRLAIKDYLVRHGKTERDILNLLSMPDDIDFQTFLEKQNGGQPITSEMTYQKFGRKWYFTAVAKYLDVPVTTIFDTARDLRNVLSQR
jgi:hypothetical protein